MSLHIKFEGKHIFLLFLLVAPIIIVNAQSASATINSVWLEHNVIHSGTVYQTVWNGWTWVSVPRTVSAKGMKIHVNFDVDNCKAQQVWVCAFFYDEDYNPIYNNSGQFKAPDGQLSTQGPATPGYESTNFNDYWLFLPYSEIHFSGKSKNCYTKVVIIKEGIELCTAEWESFTINK